MVNGDTDVELTESFTVKLSSPSNADIQKGTGVGTVQNDDGISFISVQDITAGEEDLTASFTVTLSPSSLFEVTVDYTTVDVSTYMMIEIYICI